MKQERSGFTLIELLVVIAIIAILAAILFPILVGAKQRAQQTNCMNNMSEIGKAITMYADQNNGYTPFGYFATDWTRWDKLTWRERIMPLLKSKRSLVCPVPNYVPSPGHFQTPSPYWPDYYKFEHYGMNVYVVLPDASEKLPAGFRLLSSITMSSQTILITENKDGDWSGEPWNNDSTGSDGQFHAYHGGKDTLGGNFVFCDGHASFMPVAKTQLTINNCNFYYWRPRKIPW